MLNHCLSVACHGLPSWKLAIDHDLQRSSDDYIFLSQFLRWTQIKYFVKVTGCWKKLSLLTRQPKKESFALGFEYYRDYTTVAFFHFIIPERSQKMLLKKNTRYQSSEWTEFLSFTRNISNDKDYSHTIRLFRYKYCPKNRKFNK